MIFEVSLVQSKWQWLWGLPHPIKVTMVVRSPSSNQSDNGCEVSLIQSKWQWLWEGHVLGGGKQYILTGLLFAIFPMRNCFPCYCLSRELIKEIVDSFMASKSSTKTKKDRSTPGLYKFELYWITISHHHTA